MKNNSNHFNNSLLIWLKTKFINNTNDNLVVLIKINCSRNTYKCVIIGALKNASKLPNSKLSNVLKISKDCNAKVERIKQSKSSLKNSGSYLRNLYLNNWNWSKTSVFKCSYVIKRNLIKFKVMCLKYIF